MPLLPYRVCTAACTAEAGHYSAVVEVRCGVPASSAAPLHMPSCTSSLSPDVYPPCAAKRLRGYSECGWSAMNPFILLHCQHSICGDPPWHFLLSPFAVSMFFPAWSISVVLVSIPKALGSLSINLCVYCRVQGQDWWSQEASSGPWQTVPSLEASPARSSGTGAQMQEMSWEEVRKKPIGVV